jgi:guanylate kinase
VFASAPLPSGENKNNHMEVVWVFGSSGAGKETLIRGLSRQGHQLDVIGQLGWSNSKIVVCEESLRFVAQSENDPALEQRKDLANMIAALATEENSVILVKGQDVDLELDIPGQVKSMLPQAKHRVIFVNTPIGTLFERWKKKTWWNDDYTVKTVKQWQDAQLGMLAKLQDDFAFTTVSSIDANTYTVADGLQAS